MIEAVDQRQIESTTITLPTGWVWSKLEQVSEVVLGQSPPSSTYNESENGFPFYQGKLEFGAIYPAPQKWCTAPQKLAEKGDVLISVRAPVGPSNICRERSCIGRGLAAVRAQGGIGEFFILYLLRACEKAIAEKGTGTTFSAINGQQLREFEFPLPPLREQQRIVSKIDELFTKLDAGVEALKKAKVLLKQYRLSVLKHAFEGKLTEQWREANKGKIEPASVLLEKIRVEREKRGNGKDKETPSLNASGLSQLPDGWCWARVEQVCERIVDCLHSTPVFYQQGAACVDTNCIKPGKIVADKVRFVDEATLLERNRRMKPQKNDVLFSREGALLGVAVVVPPGLEFCLGQRMMIFRLNESILPKFFEMVLNAPLFRTQYIKQIGGTASPHLNIRDIRNLLIPLPPKEEQQRIVLELERSLSLVEDTERVVQESISRSDRLRQTILRHAFEGKLVPQDPNDEPAHILLERIRQEKAKLETKDSKKMGAKSTARAIQLELV